MSYCPACGVEIGEAAKCPLCGTPNALSGGHEAECPEPARSGPFLGARDSEARFTLAERRKIALEISAVAGVIAIAAIAAIDLLVDPGLSWSLYPIASIALVGAILATALAPGLKTAARLALAALPAPLYLLALGYLTGNPAWALDIAMPLALAAELLTAAVALAIAKSRRKGLNLIAFVLLGAGVLCLAIETFLDLHLNGRIVLGWSAITAIALDPVAAFLLYLHFRVARTTSLRRLFRL